MEVAKKAGPAVAEGLSSRDSSPAPARGQLPVAAAVSHAVGRRGALRILSIMREDCSAWAVVQRQAEDEEAVRTPAWSALRKAGAAVPK